jgi:hypothetical protein
VTTGCTLILNPTPLPSYCTSLRVVDDDARLTARVQGFQYETAALLLWAAQHRVEVDQHDLLHLICKLPSQVFTAPALTASVFVWDWLLSVNKSLEVALFVEMKAAWASTVDRQLGLFSNLKATPPVAAPPSQAAAALAAVSTIPASASAHQLQQEKEKQPPAPSITAAASGGGAPSASAAPTAPVSLPAVGSGPLASGRAATSTISTPFDASKRVDVQHLVTPHVIWCSFLIGMCLCCVGYSNAR